MEVHVNEIARLASNTNLKFSKFSFKISEFRQNAATLVWANNFIYVLSEKDISLIYRLSADVISCACFIINQSPSVIAAVSSGDIYQIHLPHYCVSERYSSSDFEAEKVNCPARDKSLIAIPVEEDQRVLILPNLLDILVIENALLALIDSPDSVELRFYNFEVSSDSSPEPKKNCLTNLCIFSTEYFKRSSFENFSDSNLQNAVLFSNHPKLFLILPDSYRNRTNGYYFSRDKVLTITDSLYNSLFGRDLNLVNSAVLLIAICGGAVYWLPLKSVKNSATAKKRVEVLCVLDHDVIDIFVVVAPPFNQISPNEATSSLIFVGNRGEVLHVLASSPLIDKVIYRRYQLSDCIVCCVVRCGRLVFSTGAELRSVDIHSSLDFVTTDVVSGKHLKSIGHGLRNVIAMSSAESQNVADDTLFVVTSDYRLQSLDINLNVPSRTPDTLCTPSDVGSTLASLLTRISKVSEEYTTLTSRTRSLDDALHQLALVGAIITNCAERKLRSSDGVSNDSSLGVIYTSVEFQSRFCLSVALHNKSGFTLSSGWTFVVHVHNSASGLNNHTNDDERMSNRSISTEIRDMTPSSVRIVAIDIRSFENFPLYVCIQLVYNVRTRDDDVKAIVIPLFVHRVSILDALHPVVEGTTHQTASPKNPSNLSNILNKIAAVRRPDRYAEVNRKYNLDEFSDTLSTLNANRKIMFHLPRSLLPAANFESVFRWIFSKNPTTLKEIHLNAPSFRAVTSNDLEVLFEVVSVDCSSGATVVVHCSSMRVLAQIQLAVGTKAKESVKCTTQSDADVKRKSKQLEEVSEELRTLEELHSTSSSSSSTDVTIKSLHRLLTIYDLIRNIF